MPLATTWMEIEILILSEVSQKEKDQHHMISLKCGIQYMAQMNISTEKKQTHGHRKQTHDCQEGRGRSGKNWVFGVS